MKDIILKAENISKQYRLGTVGTGTLSHDLNRWWHKIRGKEDPYLKIGETNDRTTKGTSDYVWALQDINFEVQRGEVLGIIGKNGAGKSTLLKILSKVTAPTTGSIKSRGRIASLLEVGTGFNGELTGRENVYLNGAILGMTKKEITAKLDEIIAFSGCERYIDTPVKRYSSGMTVRLAFAVAAFLEPEILVIDEVLAVGDAEFQKKAIGKMQDISKGEGRTVLFVSHNMAAVKSLCTKAAVVDNGRIVFLGNTDEAIVKYLENNVSFESKLENIKRVGNGLLKVAAITVYGGSKNNPPQTGEPFYIELEFNRNTTIINDVRLDLKIDDSLGTRVLWFSSEFTENKFNVNTQKLTFFIPKLNLNYGSYLISTDMYVDKKRTDWVQQGFSFDVAQGKYYDRVVEIPNAETKVLLDYEANWM